MATTAPIATTATKAKPAPRMTLASVQRGATIKPHRIVLYGPPGVGKTTMAALAPRPIFIGTEDGAGALTIDRFPRPERWEDVIDAIHALTTEQHSYETVAIDSLDWAEPLIWQHVCDRGGKVGIEDFGFGKGYIEALSEARRMLSALENLQAKRGTHVIVIAHAHLKVQKNPSGEDFERWTLKVHDKTGGAVREWAEAVLFADFETFTKENESGRRIGVSTGRRVLHTTKEAAFEAKNRYALPEEIELGWETFAKAVERNRSAEVDIRALLKSEPERLKQFEAWLPRPIHELVAMRGRLEKAVAESSKVTETKSNDSNESKKEASK